MDIAKTFWIIYASVAALFFIGSSLWKLYLEKHFVIFGFLALGILWALKSFFYVSPKEKRKRQKEEEENLAEQKKVEEEKKKKAELKKKANRKTAQLKKKAEQKVAQEIEKKIEEQKVEKTKEAWNRYYKRKSFDEVVNLRGIDFEKYLVELLIKKGHKDAKLTQSGADGGIDILFTDENGIKVGIQAKGWKGSVGIDPVHRCVGAMRGHGCERGIVVTTSRFTQQAKKYVAGQNDLSLWDRDYVKKLHEELFPIEKHSFSMEEAVKLGIVVNRLDMNEEQAIYAKYGFDYLTKKFDPHKCKEIIPYSYTWPNGDKYLGEWKDGKRHGKGSMTYADGDKYAGEWKDDMKHGEGTLTLPDGYKYVGMFKDDMMHGKGTATLPSGKKYEGEWKDGEMHGKGTVTLPSGDKYVGEVKDSDIHGQGTYTWADGAKYVGEWKDNKRHGQGTYSWANGNKYVGNFKDGRASGGWFYWSNGQKTWSHKNTSGKWIHSMKGEEEEKN